MSTCDVLFAWELGGGLGHLGRLRPLAEQLRQRGKRVAFAVRDVRFCRLIFKDAEFPWFQAPIKLGPPMNEIREPRTFADILHNVGFEDVDELFGLVSAWRNLFQLLRPKVVMLEHSPSALLALRCEPSIAAIPTGLGFFCPPNVAPLPGLRPWLPKTNASATESQVLKNMNAVLLANGLRETVSIGSLYAETRETALLTFPELDHYGARSHLRYWGAWDSSWGVSPNWPTGDRCVFFYLKPCPVLRPLLESIKEFNIAAVVYAPEADTAQVRTWSGPNAVVLTEPANLKAILAHCDLAVLHATHGVATEALLAGKPLLNFPLSLEQFLLARRIQQMPAGISGSPNEPAGARELLKFAIADPTIHRGAQAFAARYAQVDPENQAAKLAESLMQYL